MRVVDGMPEAAQTRWRLAWPVLGDKQRLSLFPLFPHDVSNEPELMRIARAVGDDQLVAHLLANSTNRCALSPAVSSIQARPAHLRGLAHQSTADLERAVELLGRSIRPLALAGALEDLGQQRASDGTAPAAGAAWVFASWVARRDRCPAGAGHRSDGQREVIRPRRVRRQRGRDAAG
jgi:hypothetical protein